jgi:hypothetical protein
MAKRKTVNCKYCGMGHDPRADGNHWIVKSIIPARIDIRECAYHKAGMASPIQMIEGSKAGAQEDRTGEGVER